jgi:hypothetical protein
MAIVTAGANMPMDFGIRPPGNRIEDDFDAIPFVAEG